jgi:N-acetylneuraminate synthase
LSAHFENAQEPIGIIVNVGGFSFDGPLSKNERGLRMEQLLQSLVELAEDDIEFLPQTMPPFPWHFGGQRYHNLFVDPDEIRRFCDETGSRMCLDVSHSQLACNHLGHSLHYFLDQVLPCTAHLHLADAHGVGGEGLPLGEGDIDWYSLIQAIHRLAPEASWIPEIWQGHEYDGQGFLVALEYLEGLDL